MVEEQESMRKHRKLTWEKVKENTLKRLQQEWESTIVTAWNGKLFNHVIE